MDLLTQLGELFAVDDGSLPEIRVEGLDPQAVTAALALIKSAAIHPLRYGHEQGENAPPGARHFVVTLNFAGCELPELGFATFDDAVIVDYRMGPQWTARAVRALFELLHRICALHPGAYLQIEPEADLRLQRAFQKAWIQYLTAKGAA